MWGSYFAMESLKYHPICSIYHILADYASWEKHALELMIFTIIHLIMYQLLTWIEVGVKEMELQCFRNVVIFVLCNLIEISVCGKVCLWNEMET